MFRCLPLFYLYFTSTLPLPCLYFSSTIPLLNLYLLLAQPRCLICTISTSLPRRFQHSLSQLSSLILLAKFSREFAARRPSRQYYIPIQPLNSLENLMANISLKTCNSPVQYLPAPYLGICSIQVCRMDVQQKESRGLVEGRQRESRGKVEVKQRRKIV